MINQPPYPTQYFPSIVIPAIAEVIENHQVTDIMAATSCLTAMSISASPLVDWRHPLSGQIRSSVLNLAIEAISGDRKSTADECVCAPLYEHDTRELLAVDAEAKSYKLQMLRWAGVKKGILSRICKLELKGEPTEEMEARLERHEDARPKKTAAHRIIYQDTTRFSAFEALEGDGRAIAILTDEGQTLLKSTVMEHYGFLNNAWDGKRLLTVDRGNNKHIIVTHPRVTVSFQVQPSVLEEFLNKQGKVVHGSGFWARYLFARSPSRQGFRRPRLAGPMPNLERFHQRVRTFLDCYSRMLRSDKVMRPVLEFDEHAKQHWLRTADTVEHSLKVGYFLHDINDFGNKYMDIVGRLACLFWFFDLPEQGLTDHLNEPVESLPKISEIALRSAIEVANWHLNEFKAIFSQKANPLPEELDANRLYNYLHRTYFQNGKTWAYKTTVRQFSGLKGHRFDDALRRLISRKAAWTNDELINPHSKTKKKTEILHLHERYFAENRPH